MHFCRFGFQRFGRHIGVGNAGGACRYSQHAGGKPRFGQRSFGHCLSAGLAGGLALFPLSDHRQKFFRGCCLLQFLTKQRFHQQLSQPRQHLDMQVVCTIRSCDQKQQPYRGTIQCLVVDRLPQRYCRQRGHQHRVAFAVGNGHPAANAGRALGFPFQHIFFVFACIPQASGAVQHAHHCVDGHGLIRHLHIQCNAFRHQ